MKLQIHSLNNGKSKIGLNNFNSIVNEMGHLNFKFRRNCARNLRNEILDKLYEAGWSNQIQLTPCLKITITAMMGDIGLCLQTGNTSRFPYDLLKLQVLYLEKRIKAAFYILPSKKCANIMGSNIANSERLTTEISKVFIKVITIPIVVIGFE